jgi:hypothetical protein
VSKASGKISKKTNRGGPRPGGGRPKGARNKKTKEVIAAVEASGETPMQYMLRVMRDPLSDEKRRDHMAVSVAPYIHPKAWTDEQIAAARAVLGAITADHGG